MGLREEIETLRDRICAGLDEAHDSFVASKAVWRIVHRDLRKGRRIEVRNPVTGNTLSGKGLTERSQRFLELLGEAAFLRLVSQFEDFVFSLLRAWSLAYPQSLDAKQTTLREVRTLNDVAAIIESIVDKEMMALSYKDIKGWFSELKDRVSLKVPSDLQIAILVEIKATRNILVHNNGLVSSHYLKAAGTRARYKEGERIEITDGYHKECFHLMREIVVRVAEEAMRKASPVGKP